MRISDWSSDVCSSDLCVERRWRGAAGLQGLAREAQSREAVRVRSFEGKPCERSEIKSLRRRRHPVGPGKRIGDRCAHIRRAELCQDRSEEHTSELQSLMRISYAVFCLKKKNTKKT